MSKVKLSKKYIYKICKEALKEDLNPHGDITSKLLNNKNKIKAKIISNSDGIIGGLDLAKQTFKIVDKKILFKIKKKEGSNIKKKTNNCGYLWQRQKYFNWGKGGSKFFNPCFRCSNSNK